MQSKQDHIQAEGEISVTKMCTPLANSAAASLLVAGTPPLTSFRVILELRVADRKSVVQGTSVDFGGRRFIIKIIVLYT